ncbi:MAG: acyltransferase [Akkermansiaceae bacterium]|jgi:peptidoglycan/LPS O-acetylase OafA/YrhL
MTQRTPAEKILAPFTRVTSSGRYVPEVDGLRGLAIVLVILFHGHHLFRTGEEPVTAAALSEAGWLSVLTYFPNFFIAKGYFGVQIFFVISGMVLALPFATHFLQGENKPVLGDYFRRRLVRIEIPYLITLTFFFLWGLAFHGGSFSEMLPRYLAGLIYSHALIYDGALNPILTVSWTLEIEIQFYLLAPLLCRIFCLKNTTLRRTILLLAIAFIDPAVSKANDLLPSVIWRESILDHLSYFLAGLFLADLLLSPRVKAIRTHHTGNSWDLIGLLAWPAVFLLMEASTPVNLKPFVLILAFLAVLMGPRFRKAFSNRWVIATGMMCYTIYLFHTFFIYSIIRPIFFEWVVPIIPGNWPLNHLLMAILLLFCIILSALVFLVVEKPFARGRLPGIFRKKPPAV